MIEITIYCLISNLMFYSYGHFLKFKKFSNKIENINNRSIVGCIFLSFIGLFANFFIPLDQIFNTLLLIIGIIFLIFKKKNWKKKEIYYIFLSSFIATILIIYSNVNRPDAGLYHLPYVSNLNENKIIFGLANIHFRFGTASIMQYLSAINNNLVFGDIGIVIPLASIVSFFIIYFFNNVLKIFTQIDKITLSNIFSLFIIIFIAYKINRYSSFGNDAVAHLSLFFLVSKLLENKKTNLSFIYLIAVFAFVNKITMIIVLLIPFIIFIKNYKFKNLKLIYSISSFLIFFWIIKNIIVSGCIIYPLKQTCFEKLKWTDIKEIQLENTSGEAWSKDWPNRINKNITMQKYIKGFNWVKSWRESHGKVFFNIIAPYLVLILFLNYLLIKKNNLKRVINFNINDNFKTLFLISIFGTLLFLTKFPLYRYGYSYLITSLILLILYFSRKFEIEKLTIISKFVFLICLITIVGKQTLRYAKNYNSEFLWPRIYSFETNKKMMAKEVTYLKDFKIYIAENVCMYSKAPCTNYSLKEINLVKKNNYYFVNLK